MGWMPSMAAITTQPDGLLVVSLIALGRQTRGENRAQSSRRDRRLRIGGAEGNSCRR